MAAGTSGKGKKATVSQEQIIQQFNAMRQEQRMLVNKLAELEGEVSEHQIVIDTLKDIEDPTRKCFRMVGGILTERTVGEVLPSLMHNTEQLAQVIGKLKEQLQEKGEQMTKFRELHGIQIRGQGEKIAESESSSSKKTSSGVLVA